MVEQWSRSRGDARVMAANLMVWTPTGRKVVPLGFPHPPPHYFQPIPLLYPTTQEILLSILAPMLQDPPLCASYTKTRAAISPEPIALFNQHPAEGEWEHECDSIQGQHHREETGPQVNAL